MDPDARCPCEVLKIRPNCLETRLDIHQNNLVKTARRENGRVANGRYQIVFEYLDCLIGADNGSSVAGGEQRPPRGPQRPNNYTESQVTAASRGPEPIDSRTFRQSRLPNADNGALLLRRSLEVECHSGQECVCLRH